jgi:DNA-directed RNA polymerase I, II, and III subunit RPABC1
MASDESRDREQELKRLCRVRNTVNQMLRDRGYQYDQDMNFEDFKHTFCDSQTDVRERIRILTSRVDNSSEELMVFFSGEKKLTRDVVMRFCSQMEERQQEVGTPVTKAIIIYPSDVVAMALNHIESLLQKDVKIELFKEEKLVVNITEHKWVPKHEALTSSQTEELKQRYKLKDVSQLPRISNADPIALYYGWSVGQVIKIIRPSETAGRYVTYRRVIARGI